ncbi:MAG: cytidylate kinase-like family protein [Paludibacteraceae bacterium]|nr:cytidylate kinase-like family protein [Paludibacteraceae bacterium]
MIITIGRELGSGGRKIGKLVAEELGLPFYDKELLSEAAKKSGLTQECFERADERARHDLGVGLFGFRFPFLGDASAPIVPGFSNDTIFQFQSDTIRTIVEESPLGCVFVGRCANYVLRDKNPFNVFISATEDSRVKRIVSYFNCSEKEAKEWIKKIDKQRAAYYDFYTSVKWGEAKNYHLSLNSSALGEDSCVRLIVQSAKAYYANLGEKK